MRLSKKRFNCYRHCGTAEGCPARWCPPNAKAWGQDTAAHFHAWPQLPCLPHLPLSPWTSSVPSVLNTLGYPASVCHHAADLSAAAAAAAVELVL